MLANSHSHDLATWAKFNTTLRYISLPLLPKPFLLIEKLAIILYQFLNINLHLAKKEKKKKKNACHHCEWCSLHHMFINYTKIPNHKVTVR